MTLDLSIIVPFYNPGTSLKCAIDSIIHSHTLAPELKLEIVLVDNGSTDFSKTISVEYCDKYSFVKLIHVSPRGVSNARNSGLNFASGRYVSFVDADDTLNEQYMNDILYGILDAPDAYAIPLKARRLPRARIDVAPSKVFNYLSGWWGVQFIFAKSIAAGLVFEGDCYEDISFFAQFLDRCSSIKIGSTELYNYTVNSGSITKRDFKWKLQQLECAEKIIFAKNVWRYQALRCEVVTSIFEMKVVLRALARITPILTNSELVCFIQISPFRFFLFFPRLFRLRVAMIFSAFRDLSK